MASPIGCNQTLTWSPSIPLVFIVFRWFRQLLFAYKNIFPNHNIPNHIHIFYIQKHQAKNIQQIWTSFHPKRRRKKELVKNLFFTLNHLPTIKTHALQTFSPLHHPSRIGDAFLLEQGVQWPRDSRGFPDSCTRRRGLEGQGASIVPV